MTRPGALSAKTLLKQCDPSQFKFKSTAELRELPATMGQEQAMDSIRFGLGINQKGYNLFIVGQSGAGKHSLIRRHLEQQAKTMTKPNDCCYVYNFDEPRKPKILCLPPGGAVKFCKTMVHFLREIKIAIPTAFESEEYHAQKQQYKEQLKQFREEPYRELQKEAESRSAALMRTPSGFAFAPIKDGEVVKPEAFAILSSDEQKVIEENMTVLQQRLDQMTRQIKKWEREARDNIEALDRTVALSAVEHLIEELKTEYRQLSAIVDYLEQVQQDIIDHVDEFRKHEDGSVDQTVVAATAAKFRRYHVNVLVDHKNTIGAPVVYEDLPTYQSLLGRIENESHMGTMITDFSLIKAGALAKANGGYLILDALDLFKNHHAWDGLKRALKSSQIKIEPLDRIFNMVSMVSLQPDVIPLNIKVVLLGTYSIYYQLFNYDQSFAELFKIMVSCEYRVPCDHESLQLFAHWMAGLIRNENLRHLDREALARIVEHSARMAGNQKKLSIHIGDMSALLRESDFWAEKAGHELILADDIEMAITSRRKRSGHLMRHIHEEIHEGTVLIDLGGKKIGQINGLTVITTGNFSFGQPARITATTRMGNGDVVDIEREVQLGGEIHSKGVLILSAFLSSRYSRDKHFAVSASLVFEQSYGTIDGDSASLAELCALLSSLSEVPIKQALAVTGSINQHGEIQAIGGINEKIEGFFDICQAQNLTGKQGVIMPVANIKHLMLKPEVVQAAKQGKFHIYPIKSVNYALELLTGKKAGKRNKHGNYPHGSINHRVIKRLEAWHEKQKNPSDDDKGEDHNTLL